MRTGTALGILLIGLAAPGVSAHERAPAAGAAMVTLPPPARAAAATVDQFHAALHRGDTRGALALLAPDALVFEEGGAERSRAEYAQHHLAADAEFSSAVSSSLVRRSGDASGDLAWVTSEGRTKGTFRGKAVDRVTTETMVLRRVRGGWKIVHIHWSSAAPR